MCRASTCGAGSRVAWRPRAKRLFVPERRLATPRAFMARRSILKRTAKSLRRSRKSRRPATIILLIIKKLLVPRRGLEPPRIAPLVPETSASTSSATWAGGRLARRRNLRTQSGLVNRSLPARTRCSRDRLGRLDALTGSMAGHWLCLLTGRHL
jgi:hypothetical protein